MDAKNSHLLNTPSWIVREAIIETLGIDWEDRFNIISEVTDQGLIVLKNGKKYKLELVLIDET